MQEHTLPTVIALNARTDTTHITAHCTLHTVHTSHTSHTGHTAPTAHITHNGHKTLQDMSRTVVWLPLNWTVLLLHTIIAHLTLHTSSYVLHSMCYPLQVHSMGCTPRTAGSELRSGVVVCRIIYCTNCTQRTQSNTLCCTLHCDNSKQSARTSQCAQS